jgi:hypothetical protein
MLSKAALMAWREQSELGIGCRYGEAAAKLTA